MVASLSASLTSPTETLRHPEIAVLVSQMFALAALVGGEKWLLRPAEADAIAQPSARLLARHTVAQRIVRTYTDPLVLLAVLGAIAKTRMVRSAVAVAPAAVAAAAVPPIVPHPVAPAYGPPVGVPNLIVVAPDGRAAAVAPDVLADVLAEMAAIP